MKIFASVFIGLFLFGFLSSDVYAQKRKITIILVRHAEKDASDPTSANPQLSAEGKKRAERFARLIKKYKPRRIYATNYLRAAQTAEPIANLRKIPVQTYDAGKLAELVTEITSFKKGRRIIVVGHSNTTPALANLLIKENKYKQMPDTEYGKIWIIRMKKGKVWVEEISY